jgi:uracil-DNA glycosylase family 4
MERPGQDESRHGRVACGKAGQELDDLYLPLAGLDRSEIRVCNTVLCGEPNNKKPTGKEIAGCAPFHIPREIERTNPEVILLLGASACSLVTNGKGIDLEAAHGIPQPTSKVGDLFGWQGVVVPMFHPAQGLHEGRWMQTAMEDWRRLGEFFQFGDDGDPEIEPYDYSLAEAVDIAGDIGASSRISIDTESHDGKPWSIQYNQASGMGRIVLVKEAEALYHLQRLVREAEEVIFHNASYDLEVLRKLDIHVRCYRDTMQEAFHLGNLPQGLKPLVYRLFRHTMTSYKETVWPASILNLQEWMFEAVQIAESDLSFKEQKKKSVKVHKGELESLLTRLLRLARPHSDYDPWDRLDAFWKDPLNSWMVSHMENRIGKYPVLGIANCKMKDAIRYAVGDADWTGRAAVELARRRQTAFQIYDTDRDNQDNRDNRDGQDVQDTLNQLKLFGGVTLPGKPDLDNIRRLDAMIIPQLNRMSRIGIGIDVPYLQDLSSQFEKEMKDLESQISSYIPAWALNQFSSQAAVIEEEEGLAALNASSAVQIRTLLFDLLKVGRDQKLKSTSTGKVSTGRKNLDKVRDDHPVVPLILQYRERQKLKESFCDSLPVLAKLHPVSSCCPICELPHRVATTRLHTEFTTTRAITGRLSSRRPNLQQIPIRSTLGSRIRAAFVASPGTKLVSVDFSQMEIRDLAHLANACSIFKVYESGGDIHVNTAVKAFGLRDASQVDKYRHRLPAKRTNFSIQNGTTEEGLYAQLIGDYWAAGITPPDWLNKDWCKEFIASWHQAYPEVQPYFDTQYYRARRYGFVWGPWGRARYIPQIRSTHFWKVEEGLREAQNFAVTNSNAEQTKLAMAECESEFEIVRENGVYCEALLSIHDQVITEVDEAYADFIGSRMTYIFEHVMDDRVTKKRMWRCLIKADCDILDRWHAKE